MLPKICILSVSYLSRFISRYKSYIVLSRALCLYGFVCFLSECCDREACPA